MKKDRLVLLCEDSDVVLLTTSFMLEAEGLKVETARDTDELFARLRNETKPLMILLDLNIPGAGGRSAIRQLKERTDTKDIPIVLFSGEQKLEEISAELGADGFLCKPFDTKDLEAIVKKFCS